MSGDGELNTPATPSEDASSAASQESPLTTTEPSSYGAQDITVLEGLEAVRKRPGMYIGSTGPTGLHHLVWEVVDNSVDEAMAGHCSRIDVSILPDGGIEVRDDGRGIPVGKHPKYEDLTAAEVVLTVLHAGGKFGGDGYKVSGGLHGVGISVVNALSARVEVEIDRDGKRHAMAFGDGGELKDRLAVTGDAPTDADGASRTGTTVRFWPDGSIFDETDYRFQTLQERFQMMAFLNRGLEIRVRDQRPDATVETDDPEGWFSFKYDGGIMDFVTHVNSSKEALFQAVGYFAGAETIDDNPHEVEIAFQWNTGFNSDGLHSFANGISTLEGGMHEQGFRTAVTRTVNNYARDKGLLKEGDLVIQTAGALAGVAGSTDLVKVGIVSAVLGQGTGVGQGTVSGRVRLAQCPGDACKIERGEILVVHDTTADDLDAIRDAAAVITEVPAATSHAAVIAQRLGTPLIAGVAHATRHLLEGEVVTLQIKDGLVHRGTSINTAL